MAALADLIREASAHWEPLVESALFDTTDADDIATTIGAHVRQRLAPVRDAVFYQPGVGVVAGLRLTDGREVVLKVHRWNVTADRLRAMQRVQRQLADKGLPAPRPLDGPALLGRGLATIEELLGGAPAPGHDPRTRHLLAEGLWDLVSAGIDVASVADLGPPLMLRPAGAPLWFEPHDVRFDFAATAEGAEWIDEQATKATGILHETVAQATTAVVGHFDWRVQNLGFGDDGITGIYDWDALAIAPEPVVVGNAAAAFTSDWSTDDPDPLPTVGEMQAFVAAYEGCRGTPFSGAERRMLDAANLFLCAYGARCQHSDMQLHPTVGRTAESSWLRALRDRATQPL